MVYSDEDCLSSKTGQRFGLVLKPDWSPELMLAYNYLGRLTVMRRSLLLGLGGFDAGYGVAGTKLSSSHVSHKEASANISAGYRTACRRHDCEAGHPLGKRPSAQMGCRPRGFSVQFPSSSRSLSCISMSRIFCGSVTGGNTPLVRRLTIRIR